MKHNSVFAVVRDAAFKHKLLSVGTVLCAAASVLASLLPPLAALVVVAVGSTAVRIHPRK